MGESIHNAILTEYEKKRQAAIDRVILRKSEIYSRIPELEHIDSRIHTEGVKYNKMILLSGKQSMEAASELGVKIEDLKKEKVELLNKHGYPADYLEITHECPLCKDTGFIQSENGSKKCTCYRQQFISHAYKNSNLSLIKTENFGNFDANLYSDEINEKKYGLKISPRKNILNIKERCLEFIDRFHIPEEKNLFFSGPTGVGKTFMCNCVSKELLDRGYTVLYQTAPMLFSAINQQKAKAFKEGISDNSTYKNIFDADLLIIDDLGTESPSAARYADLLTILNTRHMNNFSKPCKTIISTNIGIKNLYEYYDERNASRIIGYFSLLCFIGDDIRPLKRAGAGATK
jgi:DNA replication protein DnaC